MKDIYIPKKVPRIEVREKLHGHTQILLRDVRTGKVERVEHDNTFTDGIESYSRDLGCFVNSPFMNDTVRGRALWKTLIGGILLFDTALPTSPDAKYMPAGTSMTANGSYGVTNAGTPVELGSFNSVESVEGANSVSLVYDWATSQGNGTIASVALTTQDGGYIGYGNQSLAVASSLRNLNALQNSSGIGTSDVASMIYGDFLYYCNRGHSSPLSSITVSKKFVPYKDIDIFTVPNVSTAEDTITFTLPDTVSGYNSYVFPAGADYPSCFIVLPEKSIASSGTFDVYFLDVSDGTVTKKTITNNTGKALAYNGGLFFVLCGSDNAIVQCSDGTKYKIKISDSSVVGEVTNDTSRNIEQRTYCSSLYFTDDLIAMTANYLYDPVLNRILPTNGNICLMAAPGITSPNYLKQEDSVYYPFEGNYANRSVTMIKNPLRLMTINNLQSAVTKTADKTMKVTYTVTRA